MKASSVEAARDANARRKPGDRKHDSEPVNLSLAEIRQIMGRDLRIIETESEQLQLFQEAKD
ncbi:MAG TPA: hypothetical protein VGI41_05020 [Candidatus Udaeobacter sp.]|jgi:hypothetical protein